MARVEIEALNESVDEVIHEPKRMALLAVLSASTSTFSELKRLAELTDGNLDSHLKKLEEAGYVEKLMRKNYLLRRQKETVFSATPKGRAAFEQYLDSMERKIRGARKASSKV